MTGKVLAVSCLCVGGCLAQQWEIGGTIGYGIYRDARVNGPGAEATVGIQNRFAAGAVVTESLYDHLSGEIRYMYQDGDPFLSYRGARANVQGQSHSILYDVLIQVRGREEKLRPFVAAGVGGKYYRTTGPSPEVQPAPNVADLVRANQWTVLVSIGGGLSYFVRKHLLLRADFRDYITPFPTKLFIRVNGGTDRGLFQQFTPMLGVSYGF
jgi:hypothetical protein